MQDQGTELMALGVSHHVPSGRSTLRTRPSNGPATRDRNAKTIVPDVIRFGMRAKTAVRRADDQDWLPF